MLPFRAIIKTDTRSKKIRIKIGLMGDVVVSKPKYCSQSCAQDFVNLHSDWIEAQLAKIKDRRMPLQLPTKIDLKAMGQTFNIKTNISGRGVKLINNEIIINRFNQDDIKKDILRLQKYIKKIAEDFIPKEVKALSMLTKLQPQTICIRNQQTRWGSCSNRGCISLNQKLLLINPTLMRYVIIHELCHLQEMNHSKNFWKLVQRYQPNFKELDSKLDFNKLPVWAIVK